MGSVFDLAAAMGRAAGERWRGHDLKPHLFPGVARSVIDDFEAHTEIELARVATDVAALGNAVPTRPGFRRNFGKPPITLYNDPQDAFFIELYLWSDTDMSIHDHAFSGAFAVLDGLCANDVFGFEREGGCEDLQLGTLRNLYSESLSRGDTREITNGRSFIHRNRHLSRPTVTLVVRTLWDGGTVSLYRQEGMALDPAMSPSDRKKAELLEGLLLLDDHELTLRYLLATLRDASAASAAYRRAELYIRRTGRVEDADLLVDALTALVPGDDARIRSALRRSHEREADAG